MTTLTMQEVRTSLDVAEARLIYVEHGAAGALVREPEVFENVMCIEWAHIAVVVPEVVVRSPSDYPRGRQYTVDQETLDTLSSLPQPPSDEYGE